MPLSAGASLYKSLYEENPISLAGGIASGVPGGAMSVLDLLGTVTTASGDDEPFANFYPLAGSSLVENQIANYPFANMTVAANAVIRQPLVVSLLMRVPARGVGGYVAKTQVMTALKNTLDQHVFQGGTFNVATPTFFYTNVLLVKLHDVSGGDTLQTQVTYQWDFIKPLVTLADAQATQSASMSLLSSGGATDGSLSGTTPNIGTGVSATSFGSDIPAASGTISLGLSGVQVTGSQF